MHCLLPRLVLSVALTVSPGCVATNYRKAPKDTPPAMALNLPGESGGPIQTQLDTIIVFDGPGSWKRRAYWDEYVVSLTNNGTTRAEIIDAHLVDASDLKLRPGDDWKRLERESAHWLKRNATVENIALGAGITAAGATFGASAFVGYLAALGGAAPVLLPAVGALLVSGGALYLMTNPSAESEKDIAEEFANRRLALPRPLRPGEKLQASLFYRITPSPRQLILTCEVDGSIRYLTIDLAALSHLHQKPGSE